MAEPMTTKQGEATARVEAIVDSKRESLALAAPEAQELHWTDLKQLLAEVVDDIYDELWDAALRGGLLHGTEDEDEDPYK